MAKGAEGHKLTFHDRRQMLELIAGLEYMKAEFHERRADVYRIAARGIESTDFKASEIIREYESVCDLLEICLDLRGITTLYGVRDNYPAHYLRRYCAGQSVLGWQRRSKP